MIEVAEKSHAVLGPSGWHTWGNCPGSVPLSEGLTVATSSYAKEGTAAHQLLEDCLSAGPKDAEEHLGKEYVVEGEVFTVDQEMADAVNSAISIIEAEQQPDGELQVEQTVPLTFMTGETDAEGTCDIAIIKESGTKLVIADFKYGKGVMVYASEPVPETTEMRPNGQLAMYALGWLQKYGLIYEDITHVKLMVLQPRLEWSDEYEITIDQLRSFEEIVRDAAGAVELERLEHLTGGAELTLVPGDKQCKFCNAKAVCPALKNHVSSSLALVSPSKPEDFQDLTLAKQAAAVTVNADVSNDRLAEFMRAIPLIEEALTAARAEVERRLFAGEEIPGYYLGKGRKGDRKWANEEAAKKAIVKRGRLSKDQAFKTVLISPAEAEKLLGKDTLALLKKDGVVTQADGKPSVCREGDKNEPYPIVSAPSDFANLDAPPTITKVYEAATQNGTVVEISDGTTVILHEGTPRTILKLAKAGEPVAPLQEAVKANVAEQLKDSAMAALMD